MFEFLSNAGRCKKSHRLAAYIVGCITAIVITTLILVFAYRILSELLQYKDFSINLFNLIEIEASRQIRVGAATQERLLLFRPLIYYSLLFCDFG